MTAPTPVTPIDAAGPDVLDRLGAAVVAVPPAVLDRIASSGATVLTDDVARAEAGRDWWPLAIGWATEGAVPQRPAVVVRPSSTAQLAAVLAACNEAVVPVTPAAGRSGVCGGSIPVHGGVALDMTAMDGLVSVDETSLTADVRAGTFGPDLEAALGMVGDGYTLGHWPQSMDLSTVGGWLACRGAGQYSTRYGKIEDMVIGLEVVLADGRVVHTEGHGPRAATGPNLTQLFVGSEGTLGVITEARLRIHPCPPAQERRAFGFTTFAEGLEACRRILRRGATPAVLRLYDQTESARNFDQPDTNVLVVLDEADEEIISGTLAVVDAECNAGAEHTRWTASWSSDGSATATTSPPWHRCGAPAWSSTRPRSRGRGPSCPAYSTRWWPRSVPWRARSRRRRTSRTPTPTGRASTSRSGGVARRGTPNGGSVTTGRRGTW